MDVETSMDMIGTSMSQLSNLYSKAKIRPDVTLSF